MFLESFSFPSVDDEWRFFMRRRETVYDSFYPFQIIARQCRTELEFAPVTILYGENGSGKSTALNAIAGCLELDRLSPYNQTPFFANYLRRCSWMFDDEGLRGKMIITSDDVFDEMFRQRRHNRSVDAERDAVRKEYNDKHGERFQMQSLDDLDALKKHISANRRSRSQYIREYLNRSNIRTHSNGESAIAFFSAHIIEQGLYLLDEPENSLSPATQLELIQFLEEQARFFGCQFVIATHSPFVLSMTGALIYNMDSEQIKPCKWTELPNVRAYYELFQCRRGEFSET